MTFLAAAIDLFLHLDVHLQELIALYGPLVYLILFLTILCETGLVVTPFLPGDSLLFAAGTFAAAGSFNLALLFVLLCVAAILGDTANYAIGSFIGPKVFSRDYRFLNRGHLLQAEAFYEKHGAKAIVIARFLPIVRTLAPFVAGVSRMHYGTFVTYNVAGGVLWVAVFLFSGYFFGNIPWVKDNFSIAILIIIVVSVLPGAYHYAMHRWKKYCALKLP